MSVIHSREKLLSRSYKQLQTIESPMDWQAFKFRNRENPNRYETIEQISPYGEKFDYEFFIKEIADHLKNINFDPKDLLKITTLGGGDGASIPDFASNLYDLGYEKQSFLNIDPSLSVENHITNLSAVQVREDMRNTSHFESQKNEFMQNIGQNFIELGIFSDEIITNPKYSYLRESTHAIYSRHMIQYRGKGGFLKTLNEVNLLLKPGGIAVFIWPGARDELQAKLNCLPHHETQRILSGSTEKSNTDEIWYPTSLEEAKKNVVKSSEFELVQAEMIPVQKLWSPLIYTIGGRFNVDEKKKSDIYNLINKYPISQWQIPFVKVAVRKSYKSQDLW
jgi:SAM-dependent methyltransferase